MTGAVPNLADFRFRYPNRVRFAEVDAQAVLHNARYFEFFEIGLQEYWRAIGRYEMINLATDTDFHIVKSEMIYLKPITLDEIVDIWVRTSRIGTTSVTYEMQLHTHELDELRATGAQVHVRVDRAGGRPVPLDAIQIAKLEAFERRQLR